MHKRRLQMLAARWRRGAITVHDLRSVADELLTEGEASPALIELFSLREDAVPSEGPPLFERALQELAAQTLDEDTSSKAMAQWAADAALYGMANPETVTAIEEFVEAIPELEPAWRAHLDDYGYPLPRVFFGSDVSRFAAPLSESGDEPLQERFASAIERLAASDDPTVVKAIRVSFMTGRVGSEEAVSRLLEALPAFRPYYESEAPEPGEKLLLHPVMGELARFYLEQGLAEQPGPRRTLLGSRGGPGRERRRIRQRGRTQFLDRVLRVGHKGRTSRATQCRATPRPSHQRYRGRIRRVG